MNAATIRRRAGALLVPLVAAAAVSAVVLPSARATPKVTVLRLGGSDRYATAAVIAEHAFPNGTSNAVVARGADFANGTPGFADALSANYVAGDLDAPILLTGDGLIPQATLQALQTLKVKNVILMGGPNAISNAAEAQLQGTPSSNAAGGNLNVARVAGADRYATAATGAGLVPVSYIKSVNGKRSALVARGDAFPDALAGGPLAYGAQLPLLLTDPGYLSAPTSQALQNLGIQQVFILGGTAAVSTNAEQQIQQLGITTTRLAGANRQLTAIAVANFAIQQLGFKNTLVGLARGDSYPDALAGGPEAAKADPAPIVLTGSANDLSTDTATWLRGQDGTLAEIDVYGLQGAVSDAVAQQAAGDATCVAAVSTTTSTTAPLGILTTLLGGGTTAPPTTASPYPPCPTPTTGGSTTLPPTTSTTAGVTLTTPSTKATTTTCIVLVPPVTFCG